MQKPFQQLAKVAGAFLLVLACVVSAAAQVTTGNVAGTVTDPQGAAVPGAEVTLTDKGTGQSQTQQTSDTGEFRFSNLQPGTYNITIKAQNFKALSLTDVRVSLGQTTDVPAQLTIGLAGETVEV
jgi:Carboxypeptidase regulatory-like domain